MLNVKFALGPKFNSSAITGHLPKVSFHYLNNAFSSLSVRPCAVALCSNRNTASSSRWAHSSRTKKAVPSRHDLKEFLEAKKRKLKREKLGREKLASILNLQPKHENTHHELRTVDDLKRMLPNMPYEDQAKVAALIEEYGDKLNDCFKNFTDLANQAESENSDVATEEQQSISKYGAAIELIQGMVEEIVMLEQESEGLVKSSTYANLWKNVQLFSQMERDPRVDPPLELLVILFQLAKNQKGSNIRTKSIRLVGDVLYNLKLVRLDPYNEVDYLNSLVDARRINDALKIWKSRLNKKDVENSIWWVEVGTCLYQEVYDFENAEKLALELIQKHDYVPPKVVSRFIKLYSESGKLKETWKWCDYMMSNVEENGHVGEELDITGDMEPEEAEIVFNQKTVPTEKDIIDLLNIVIKLPKPAHSLQMIERVNKIGIRIPSNILIKTLRTIAKNCNIDDTEQTLSLISALRKVVSKEKLQNIVVGDNILDQVAYLLLESNPELQSNKRFYQEWIYGLVMIKSVNRIYEVLGDMSKNNIQPTQLTIQYLIKSLLNNNRLTEALELLEKMENRETYSQYELTLPHPSPIHYSALLQFAARRRNEDLIIKILEKANIYLKNYDESMYLALFHYFYRTKNFTSFCMLLSVPLQDKFQTFSSEGYKVIWTIIRDYFRTYPKSIPDFTFFPPLAQEEHSPLLQLAISKNFNPTETIDPSIGPLKFLIFKMLKSASFVPSLDVYERVLQTLLLSHDHISFFALLRFISENNKIPFDPAFAIRLTKLAEKMGKIIRSNSSNMASPRPPTIPPVLFSSTSVQSVAINNILSQSYNTSTIPFEVLVESLSMALGFKYKFHSNFIDNAVKEFTTPL